MMLRAKGQQNHFTALELLALASKLGGLAERSNAVGLQPIDGALITVQGFESLTRRLPPR